MSCVGVVGIGGAGVVCVLMGAVVEQYQIRNKSGFVVDLALVPDLFVGSA